MVYYKYMITISIDIYFNLNAGVPEYQQEACWCWLQTQMRRRAAPRER
jgi:hypothetical protein